MKIYGDLEWYKGDVKTGFINVDGTSSISGATPTYLIGDPGVWPTSISGFPMTTMVMNDLSGDYGEIPPGFQWSPLLDEYSWPPWPFDVGTRVRIYLNMDYTTPFCPGPFWFEGSVKAKEDHGRGFGFAFNPWDNYSTEWLGIRFYSTSQCRGNLIQLASCMPYNHPVFSNTLITEFEVGIEKSFSISPNQNCDFNPGDLVVISSQAAGWGNVHEYARGIITTIAFLEQTITINITEVNPLLNPPAFGADLWMISKP